MIHEDPLQESEAEASLDEALEREEQHDREREAAQRQGRIEKETREHRLDEG